jgi:hypothetical protein
MPHQQAARRGRFAALLLPARSQVTFVTDVPELLKTKLAARSERFQPLGCTLVRRTSRSSHTLISMNDKAQDVTCPTCDAAPGKPCCRENGSVLADSHLARKTLASAQLAKALKKSASTTPPDGE